MRLFCVNCSESVSRYKRTSECPFCGAPMVLMGDVQELPDMVKYNYILPLRRQEP